MAWVRLQIVRAFLICLVTSSAAFAQDDMVAPGLESNVAHLESQLAKHEKLLKRRVSTEARVDAFRAALARAKHDLAAVKQDKDAVESQTRALLEVRERQLQRIERMLERRLVTKIHQIQAERRVAVNRHLLADFVDKKEESAEQLKAVVSLCEQEYQWWKSAAEKKLTTKWRLNEARSRWILAKYKLAKLEDADFEKELRSQADWLEQEWKQFKTQHERKLLLFVSEVLARAELLNAKIRLAHAESKPKEVTEHLAELVKLHRETLDRVRSVAWETHLTQSDKRNVEQAIAAALDRDKRRLAEFRKTGKLTDDLTTAALDP